MDIMTTTYKIIPNERNDPKNNDWRAWSK